MLQREYEVFLRSPTGESMEHYDAVLRLLEEFGERNRRFGEMVRERTVVRY